MPLPVLALIANRVGRIDADHVLDLGGALRPGPPDGRSILFSTGTHFDAEVDAPCSNWPPSAPRRPGMASTTSSAPSQADSERLTS